MTAAEKRTAQEVVDKVLARVSYPKCRIRAEVKVPLDVDMPMVSVLLWSQDRPNNLCDHGAVTDLRSSLTFWLDGPPSSYLHELPRRLERHIFEAIREMERHEAAEAFKIDGRPPHWPHEEISYEEAKARHKDTCPKCYDAGPKKELTGLQALLQRDPDPLTLDDVYAAFRV